MPTVIDFDTAHIDTQRWFLTLALADFIDAKDAAVEARECALIGESGMQARALEMAALFYARPFHYCVTPSSRNRMKMPRRFLEQLDWRLAAAHFQALGLRNRLVAHTDLSDRRLTLRGSSTHQGMNFAAALAHPCTPSSDVEQLVEIIDRFIAMIKSELATIVVGLETFPMTLQGTEQVIEPARDD